MSTSFKEWCEINNPTLLEEWDYGKNGDKGPQDYPSHSNLKVWWSCNYGHTWQATINNRTYHNSKCPYCSGRKVWSGYNDLETKNPELADEWHPTKNGDLRPSEVLAGGNQIVWWRGTCGHEWEDSIYHRVKGHGCPICSGKRLIRGLNDLGSLYPDLAKEWHPTKNGVSQPSDHTIGSHQKVWWQCKNGHEWQAVIKNRTFHKSGCPFCAGQRVIQGVNDLQSQFPDIAKEWHPMKNGDLKPNEVTARVSKKVWWIGACGHEWCANIGERTRGDGKATGCPYCSGNKVLKGFNDFATEHPELIRKWHPTKNGDLKPSDFSSGSNIVVWWTCDKGHEWEWPISSMRNEKSCPYCSGKRVWAGFNDIATTRKDLAKQWDYDKNADLRPSDVTSGSSKKVWWICNNGHSFESTVYNRSIGLGCPYCSGKKVLAGYNDLLTREQRIATEWHPTKNGDLKPTDVTIGSDAKVWWLGSCGHEWQATVGNKVNGSGCPYCSNKLLLTGFNDFKTKHPEMAREWHPEKNGSLTPDMILASYDGTVWWLGECGHEWKAKVSHRHYTGAGCPICIRQLRTSYNEQGIYYYVSKQFPDTISGYRAPILGQKEIDIYIPSIRIGIEYDGQTYHKNVAKDVEKATLCKNNGIQLLRLREPKCPELPPEVDHVVLSNVDEYSIPESLDYIQYFIHDKIGIDVHFQVNLDKDKQKIDELVYISKKSKSVASDSIMLSFWHATENGSINPQYVSKYSDKKYWWHADCGHEWYQSPHNMVGRTKCPYCYGGVLKKGFNDLSTRFPDIAAEWHPTKNGILKPEEVIFGYTKKVWWLGKCGHEWEASPSNRVKNRSGCPFCGNKKVLPGFNDLQTLYPDIAAEWHPTKNGDVKPSDVLAGSQKRYWWLGKCGHEWNITISGRTFDKSGCPYCAGKLLSGYNDLQTLYPDIAAEWHPTKNGTLKPSDVKPKSWEKIWWICDKGHEWQTSVNYRVKQQQECPHCKKMMIKLQKTRSYPLRPKRKNRLELNEKMTKTINFEQWCRESGNEHLLAEWSLNNSTRPADYNKSSKEYVLWVCPQCHADYSKRIVDRAYDDRKVCPSCGKQRGGQKHSIPKKGESLGDLHHELIAEWSDKNEKTPFDYKPVSGKKVWWKCLKGHDDYYTSIASRTYMESGCPECSKIFCREYNKIRFRPNPVDSLLEKRPDLVSEWSESNEHGPEYYKWDATAYVSWICKRGHNDYRKSIRQRTVKGEGCPICYKEDHPEDMEIFQKPEPGKSLGEVHPELIPEWSKNNKHSIYDYKPHSSKKVLWICPNCQEEYPQQINSKVDQFQGCPTCSGLQKTSKNQQAIYFSLKDAFPNLEIINRYSDKVNGISEIDVYIPAIKVGIEYDGLVWHNNTKLEKQLNKDRTCKQLGIKLIHIKEYYDGYFGPKPEYWLKKHNSNKELEAIVNDIIKTISSKYNQKPRITKVDFWNYYREILETTIIVTPETSLAKVNPELIPEWSSSNGKLTPYLISYGSHKKVFWICPLYHETYLESPNKRHHGRGHPKCRYTRIAEKRKMPKKGESFGDLHKDHVQFWSDKNDKTPYEVRSYSSYEAVWICRSCKNEFKKTVASYTGSGGYCSNCSPHQKNGFTRPDKGKSFKDQHEDLVRYWSKSNEVSPDHVKSTSHKKVKWYCTNCGKEYEQAIRNRCQSHGWCADCKKQFDTERASKLNVKRN